MPSRALALRGPGRRDPLRSVAFRAGRPERKRRARDGYDRPREAHALFLPIGDSPNVPKAAWVTWGLIAVNVAVFLALLPLSGIPADPADPAYAAYVRALAAERGYPPVRLQLSAYDLFCFRHGFRPAAPSLIDALTGMFLHGGWMHLLGNMLFLWIYGDNVEHRLGRAGYLLAYLGTGLAAALGDGLLRFGSGVPSIGASGAISGVLGFYFIWFPYNRVRVWVFLFPFLARVIELPARVVLGIYIVADNLLPLLLTGGAGSVSYGAHVGGFAAGCAAALAIDRWVLLRHGARRARPAPVADVPPERLLRQALLEGDVDRAAQLFFALPAPIRRALGPGLALRLGQELDRAGRHHAALAVFQRMLADHPHGPGRALAHAGAARVQLEELHQPTAAYQHLLEALDEAETEEEAAMVRRLLAALRARTRTVPRHPPL
ncbi:MAG: rhomboid family intramembrane serine protease [Acidobacteria bacterium]|nr:MAG: rhomboid family intramembrane serine protease [Acidobacteriota bacterium]